MPSLPAVKPAARAGHRERERGRGRERGVSMTQTCTGLSPVEAERVKREKSHAEKSLSVNRTRRVGRPLSEYKREAPVQNLQ